MTKKLVITANMNTDESVNLAPTAVIYQWHWQRIIMVSSIALVALAILVYSFIGAVNAEQSPLDEPQPVLTNAELQTPLNDIEQNGAAQLLEGEQSTTESLITEANISNISKPKVTALDQEVANQQTVDEPLQPETFISSEEPLKAEEQPELAAVPNAQQQFSQSAHIASVAMGAKIDTIKVSRAVLTTDVVDREPVNVLKNDVKLAQISNSLSFFSELRNMQGQTVRHLWYYQDQQLASIELAVSSPRFRTYSTKNIMPEQLGDWRVEVMDAQGSLLAQKEFRVLAD